MQIYKVKITFDHGSCSKNIEHGTVKIFLNSPLTFYRDYNFDERWSEVSQQINSQGFYDLNLDELIFGARTAWRNAARCSGRSQVSFFYEFHGEARNLLYRLGSDLF